MFVERELWTVRGNDFSKAGWHTRPTVGYQLMFEFLRLSPSYELARVARTTGLSQPQKDNLPSDFDRVLNLYDLLGDVQSILFRAWWLRRGLKAFGNPYTKPTAHKVARLAAEQDVGIDDLRDDLNLFLADTRRAEGLSASMLVSIPLGGRRADILNQVKKLLDENAISEQDEASKKSKIQLLGQRMHVNAIFKGVKLLWFKAAKPKWENWRLGAHAKLSESYSSVLDSHAPKKSATPIEQDDRIIMGKITFRAVKKFENIAENAARGDFPTDNPVECSEFDYPALAKRIQRKNRWEKAEKVRLTELSRHRAKQRLAKGKEEVL